MYLIDGYFCDVCCIVMTVVIGAGVFYLVIPTVGPNIEGVMAPKEL